MIRQTARELREYWMGAWVHHPSIKAIAEERPIITAGLTAATIVVGVLKNNPALRDVLPEPWDVVDHIANFMPSVLIGRIAAKHTFGHYIDFMRTPSRVGAQVVALGSAIVAGVLANRLGETQVVSDLFAPPGGEGRIDPIDLYYGVAGSAVGGLLYRMRSYTPPAINQPPQADV